MVQHNTNLLISQAINAIYNKFHRALSWIHGDEALIARSPMLALMSTSGP